MYTVNTLKKDLCEAGILPDDTLLIHSSMKKIGPVEGGADTVLDALMQYLGERGLLLFPTLSYHLNAKNPEFSVSSTPTIVGILPELFRQRPGVVRSAHPTHSIAGFGKDARSFLAGHEFFDTPCAPKSPWGRLMERNAKIAFIGTGIVCNTFLHGIEERAGVPNILTEEAAKLFVTLENGERIAVPSRSHRCDPEHSQFYGKMYDDFVAAGALRTARFGDAEMIVLQSRPAGEIALKRLREDPGYFTHM